jgi:hypothetical protein
VAGGKTPLTVKPVPQQRCGSESQLMNPVACAASKIFAVG